MLSLPEECRGPRTYAQLCGALGRRRVDRLRADGRIRQIWGVLVPRESLLDPDTRAALTGLTAAALQGCPAAATPVVHVAVPYWSSLRTTEGLVVHQGRGLLNEVIAVRELRTVALEVAITELLCTDSARRALAVADQAAAQFIERERSAFRGRIADRLVSRADRRGTAPRRWVAGSGHRQGRVPAGKLVEAARRRSGISHADGAIPGDRCAGLHSVCAGSVLARVAHCAGVRRLRVSRAPPRSRRQARP
jgi:hypothetical protein